MKRPPLVSIGDVTKTYPGVAALRGVSFDVHHAQIHALLGENGAGKSTLIRILSGVERPDRGHLLLDEHPYEPASPLDALRQGISTLYQEQSLLSHRTVADNILLGAESRRFRVFLDRRHDSERTSAALERVGASHIRPSSYVRDLSTADRQMVDIARALLRDSKLLILDEPTAALSAREVDALFDVVTALPAQDVSVLLVSHRLDEIFRICAGVTVLRDGVHVLTAPIEAVNSADLVTAMVGEDVKTAVPTPVNRQNRGVLLRTRKLSGATFSDVSIDIMAGEVVAVTGITGSGKEELAEVLYGARRPRAGMIEVEDRPVTLNPRTAIALGVVGVPGDRSAEGVIGELSVARNLALPSLRKLTRLGFLRRRAEAALAERRTAALAIKVRHGGVAVKTLSGGNQQKVALGKWLERAPRLLVLVEPTQGIDVKVRYEFYRLIRELAAQGSGVVLVSSDLPEVLTLADRAVVLRQGRVVGTLDQLSVTAEDLVRLSFGETDTGRAAQAASAVTAVDQVGQPLSLRPPSTKAPT